MEDIKDIKDIVIGKNLLPTDEEIRKMNEEYAKNCEDDGKFMPYKEIPIGERDKRDKTYEFTMAKCPVCDSYMLYSPEKGENEWKCTSCNYTVIHRVMPSGYIRITNEAKIAVHHPINRFHRFMMKLLLGWKYEPYKEGGKR